MTPPTVEIRIAPVEETARIRTDDLSLWLIGWAAPALLELEEGGNSAVTRGTAEALRRHAMALRQRAPSRTARDIIIARTRHTRLDLQRNVERVAGVVRGSHSTPVGRNRHRSLREVLAAEFPALHGAAAEARRHPAPCDLALVDEAYRACAAVICRSLMLGQLTGAPPRQMMRAYDRSVGDLGMWAAPAPRASGGPARVR